jgi:hypothetical protein
VVTGVANNGAAVTGTVKSTAAIGSTTLDVVYDTSAVQSTYVNCQVGGLTTAAANSRGCFQATRPIIVGGTTITPTAVINLNDRTLQKFSTQAQSKMYTCSINCPYVDYNKFYTYYNDFSYADSWVLAALDGTATPTSWANGAADFATVSDSATRREAAKKGTAYMNVWMYAIREFEDAIGDCQAACTGTACNEATAGPVHAWDEGVAFYTGSVEGNYGEGSGKVCAVGFEHAVFRVRLIR